MLTERRRHEEVLDLAAHAEVAEALAREVLLQAREPVRFTSENSSNKCEVCRKCLQKK